MRIIPQRMQRIGRERGGVVAVELGKRGGEARRRRMGRCESVGLELLAARKEACERLQWKHEDGNDQREPGKEGSHLRRGKAKRLVERGLPVEPAQERQ